MRSRCAAAWTLLACLLIPARPGAAAAAGDSTGTTPQAPPCASGSAHDSGARQPAALAAPAHADTLLRFLTANDRAGHRGLLRADRLQHGSLSFTLAASAGLAGRPRAEALGFALTLGLAKELNDGRRGRFDPVDLAADLTGALLGAWAAARR